MDVMGNFKKEFTAVEVGVSKGDNAVDMLDNCPKISRLYLVDSYQPWTRWFTNELAHPYTPEKAKEFVQKVAQRFAPYNGRVKLIIRDSVEASKLFADESIDYIYIDASHDYESVKKDLTAWYPKVKLGGMLAGHDSYYDGVQKAVIEFAANMKIHIFSVSSFSTIGYPPSRFSIAFDWWTWKFSWNNS